MLSLVENVRRKHLAWVEAVLAHKRWKPSRLAKEGGFDHSTLSKFLNDPTNSAQLGSTTIEKIALVGGIPPFQTKAPGSARGMTEGEATPYAAGGDEVIARAIAAIQGGRNGIDPWLLNSRALENAGLLPGDILLIDQNADAVDGDVVCAQVLDSAGRVETVMRVYEKPFLVTATNDQALRKPLLVDGDRVQLRGVMLTPLRPRRAA